MSKNHPLLSMGLTQATVDAMQATRNAYSALHAAKHLGDLRVKRDARRQLERAKRMARDCAEWH